MEMQTDFRAGSPCRQAATEIMEDISMETGMDDEAYRRDMINVFPGHPALPQQTHNLQGQLLLNSPRVPGAPGATMIGNYGPQHGVALYNGPTEAEASPPSPSFATQGSCHTFQLCPFHLLSLILELQD